MSRVRETTAAFRRPTNVSLDATLIEQAKELGINISRACEQGLAKQVSDERNRRWAEDNKEAIQGYNAWIEEHGLPLAEYRQF